jgi:hypothetical protein
MHTADGGGAVTGGTPSVAAGCSRRELRATGPFADYHACGHGSDRCVLEGSQQSRPVLPSAAHWWNLRRHRCRSNRTLSTVLHDSASAPSRRDVGAGSVNLPALPTALLSLRDCSESLSFLT